MGNLDRFPLLIVHHLLAREEEYLDYVFTQYEDGTLDQWGKSRLDKWRAVETPAQLNSFLPLAGCWHEEVDAYISLANYARYREEIEIAELLKGKAA